MPKTFDDEYRHGIYAPPQQHYPPQHHHHQHQQPQQTYYLPSQPTQHYIPPPPTTHLPTLPAVLANGNGYAAYGAPPPMTSTPAPTLPTAPSTPSPTNRASASPYAHGGHSARANPLHRGEACLTCRRRKMKCDAGKPACGPCSRQGKGDECEYEESKFLVQIARLESEVERLRARVRELEGPQQVQQHRSGHTTPVSSSTEGATTPPGSSSSYGNGVRRSAGLVVS